MKSTSQCSPETIKSFISSLLPVCQRLEMCELTYHTALLRFCGDNEQEVVSRVQGVDQTLLHNRLQQKYTRIARTYEIESQSDDATVRRQALANVVIAIEREVGR